MSKVVAVLISDIHFTLQTLDPASYALTAALETSESLRVPLVIAGDTLDGKALVRAECANRLISILSPADPNMVYILVGNHDMVNERGEDHALRFLTPYAKVIEQPVFIDRLGSWLIPYQNSQENLTGHLERIERAADLTSRRLITHQGVQTAFMGHYVTDKTSLPKEAFSNFRVISGHYHRAQNIKCGRPRKGAVGLFSYIGNPYTLTFSEAGDGPKGYQLLHDDGILTQVPLTLRKHVVLDLDLEGLDIYQDTGSRPSAGDIVWLKLRGPKSELDKIDKKQLGERLFGHSNFKLDKIAADADKVESVKAEQTEIEILDSIIDGLSDTPAHKEKLKRLWREVLS